jgi:hypothetical protein
VLARERGASVKRSALGLHILCGLASIMLASASGAQSVCDPVEISPNESFSAELEDGDCLLASLPGSDPEDGAYVDVYRVTVAEDGFLSVGMNSAAIDAFLYLTEEDFIEVVGFSDDVSGTDSNALISSVPVSAGSYLILATSFDFEEVGPYQLETSFDTTGNPACATSLSLSPPAVADGTLAEGDCTFAQLGIDPFDSTFLDQYRVELPAGGDLNITLESTDFNPYLWVYDETLETVIDFNDDVDTPPGNVNSALDLSLAPGTYIILANSILAPDQTGAYTLTLIPEPSISLMSITALGSLFALTCLRRGRGRNGYRSP